MGLQDEVYRIDEARKGAADSKIDSLRVRLECLQDDVGQISQSSKHIADNELLKAYVEERVATTWSAETAEIGTLRTNLSGLRDEFHSFFQRFSDMERQKDTTSRKTDVDLGRLAWTVDSLMATVEELSR